jgi:hypothetical protein
MQSTPNSNPPAGNLQPDLYAAVFVTLTLAVVAVALRFLARRLVRAPVWLDDWLALLALVCSSYFIHPQYFPSLIITSFQGYYDRV